MTLLLHRGSTEVTRDELKAVRTPPATRTWTPIPHVELLDAVRREVTSSGLAIARETLGVSQAATAHYGDRFFGLLEIQGNNGTFAMTVAVRNSHDQKFPAGLCVGSRVLICDNLAFSAEVVIARKHTVRIRRDLPRLITDVVGRLGDLRAHQDRRIEAYQQTTISDPQFHDLAIRAMDAQVIPATKVPYVLETYRRPPFEAFEPRTLWSGFNAFTEVLKGYDPQDLPRRTRALHGLCDLLCGLN